MSDSKLACSIAQARTALDDAMPRECFPEPSSERHHDMMLAKNVADASMHALDAEMRSGLKGMDETQALRAWHSVCTRCLFNVEQAVMTYGS